MEIKNTRKLGLKDYAKIELKETKRAANASEFKLRVVDGKVTVEELTHMLTLARGSKSYKKNAENFQFKLKSDSKGQYLMLKQQGLWSNLKGYFGKGHEAREKERAAAKNFINNLLKDSQLPDKAYTDKKYDNQISLKQAKEYQLSMMNTSSISPTMTKGLEMVGVKDRPLQKAKEPEKITMDMLARNSIGPEDDEQSIEKLLLDKQSTGNISYQHIVSNEVNVKNVSLKEEIIPRKNSLMPAPSEAHESNRILAANYGGSQIEVEDDEQSQDSFIEKNRNSNDVQQLNDYILGMLLKDHNSSSYD